jgi:AcrR family transcriptional regulator
VTCERIDRRRHPYMCNLHRVSGWLATLEPDLMASERTADDWMEPLLGEALAGGFGLPDVEVAQMAIVQHLGDVEDEAVGRLIAEVGDDLVVDVEGYGQILRPGIGHERFPPYFNPKHIRMNTAKLCHVDSPVKRTSRPYNTAGRRANAQRTRRAILEPAARLFVERGYLGTTVADVATAAGVALDTIYAVVGRKPTLFRLLIESAISGTEAPVPADERDYVIAIQAETQAARKLELYAQAMRSIHLRLAPLLRVLQVAAPADPELAAVWSEIAERRARNMRMFVADVAGTGALRPDISVEDAADVIWATNSHELYALLVHERRWDPDHYADWLADAWQRLLLRNT